jgi:hypothetical protein
MAVTSVTLSITLAVLCWVSARNDGLRKDIKSVGLLAARRYLPTILVVLFTQVLSMISEDIKRTVPFARLARFGMYRIDMKHTISYVPKPWWKTLRKGLAKNRNGGRVGWVLVFSSLATGISLLTISTLSSSLLATESVVLKSSPNLKRFALGQDEKTPLIPSREAYSNTTSRFLFNVSTSMWVSDFKVTLPFGPPDLETYPDYLPDGEWKTESYVF